MTEPLQYFSIARNTDSNISVSVTTSVLNDTLVGCSIEFALYTQSCGIVTNDVPVLVKSTTNGITIPVSPPDLMEFDVSIARTDIASFTYGNYYFEATASDEIGNQVTVISGIVAITTGEN